MKNVLLLLLVCACSHLRQTPTLTENSKESAAWLYAPYEECREETELCATGEAKTMAQADAQAKINLASIFEVQVKSDLNIQSSSDQSFPWQSQVRQEVQKTIEESVQQVLEGVQVKKHFKKSGLTYALASLNRAQASELIGGRIQKIDTELEALWNKKQRTNLRKVVKLALEREKLNERYSIVADGKIPEKVTFEEIIAWRETRPKAEPLLLIVGQAPDWMQEKVKEILTESGFQLVNREARKVLALNVTSIKEFLNVEGFEKYTFTLTMTSTISGEKKRVISASETVTGRTQVDALLKVKQLFTAYIEQHLSDLDLD